MDRRHTPPLQDPPPSDHPGEIDADGLPLRPPDEETPPRRPPLFDRRTGLLFAGLAATAVLLVLIIAGLLNLPGEFALYDIIMEHFGPDTVPR